MEKRIKSQNIRETFRGENTIIFFKKESDKKKCVECCAYEEERDWSQVTYGVNALDDIGKKNVHHKLRGNENNRELHIIQHLTVEGEARDIQSIFSFCAKLWREERKEASKKGGRGTTYVFRML
jgi:hypothetical protein